MYIEIVLAAIISIYAVIEGLKWKKLKWHKKTIVLLSICLAFIIAWNSINEIKKQNIINRTNASFGELVDPTTVMLPTLKIGNEKDFITIFLDKTGVFNFGGFQNIFKAYIKDNRLFLNMIIRNSKGQVIAVINDNIWKIFDHNYEYNDDKNAFEIVTQGERKVYFHIELIDGVLKMEGFVFPEEGYGWLFTPTIDGKHIAAVVSDSKSYEFQQKKCTIKTIFKYPREKYYGIRDY